MSRESILERNRKRAQENDQKMGATALGTSALNYSTQRSLERAAAEKVARESAGGLIDVSQPWLNTITPVSSSSRSASRWSGTTPSSRGGGFGETESQGEGYFTQSRQSPLERANNYAQGTAKGIAGAFGSGIGGLLDAADYAVREFVRTTFTLPDGVLEEKGLDTPEMREDIQRFNETMNRENPLVQGILDLSDQALNESAEQYARSKVGVGPLGSLAMDLGRVGVEMLTDAGIAAATGGSGLIPMAVRSFGAGSSQARREGASSQEAFLSGAAQGTIDAATERLFGIALPFARLYGGGSLDDVVQRGIQSAVSRFASTEAGQRALGGGLTVAASALTEGAEEFIADWASWQLPNIIYGGDVASVEETLSNSLYDFMLGSVMGGLGGVVSPSTYNYQLPSRQENAGGVVNSDTTTGMEAPESPGSAQDTAQNDNIPEATRRAVDLLASGQEITGGQAERIARSPEAVALLSQLTGTEVNTDAPISRVKADIRAVAGTRSSAQEERRADGDIGPYGGESRPAAQRVYDVNRVRGAASSMGMGESGQRAISAAYDGSVEADRYYAGFTAYYEAGLSGRSRDQVRSDYAADLTEAQRYAAYTAGQNDAAASLAREKLAAQFAQTAGEDSGLVYDDFVREAVESGRTASGENGSGPVYLTQETAERVNSVAKALGLRVRFVDQVDGGRANAEIAGSEVQIEKNNPLPVQFLMGHEVTHRLQELAPEEYRAFREAAAQDEMVQTYVRRYAEGDSGLTYEQALDEASADYAGRLLEDGELLDQFIGRNQDNRTLLEKVRDAIRTLVRKLTGAEKKAAQTAEGKLSAALKAGARRAETLRERQGDGTMESRYSLKEDGDHGRTREEGPREETREDFLRRSVQEGLKVVDGGQVVYGFRRLDRESAGENARQVQEEVTRLGLDADIIDEGRVLRNVDGVTIPRPVLQATTIARGHILINNNTTLSPRNIAGHEAFHYWKNGIGRDSYIEVIQDNLAFSSADFLEYQSSISQTVFGQEVDLTDSEQMGRFTEELYAYISGDIHEGTNEAALRPMFRDFDAVRAAWEQLVEENRGRTTRSRYSLKEDGTNGADGQERQFPEGAGPEEAVRRFYAEAERRGQTVRVFQRNGQTGRGAKSRLRLGRFTEVTADAATETAVQTKAELEALGIPAFIHAGDLEVMNKNGEILRSAEDSATVNHAAVGIANEIQIAPKETAGHEAYHFWKGSSFRQSYSDLVYSEIKWNSPEFFDLYDHINKNYFDNNYDMDDPEQRRAFNEELVAYISGQLHNGEDLSGLLGNPATVQSAWETLVEENRGTQARESRKGFSVDRELDREIRQIVKEAREGGRSETEVRRAIRDTMDRTLVRRLTGTEKRAAQTAEGKLSAALKAGARHAETLRDRRGDDTMESRYSRREDGNHGRTREETREAFLRRAAGAGYAVYEGEPAAYGFRRAGQPDDGGNHGEITQEAQDTQRELTALGVSADIVDGPILRNRNGVTEERAVTQAVTVDRSHIFISKDTTLSPRNIAGHEAFHLWKSGTGRDSYIEILEDNLLFSSEAFREYQTPIAEAYLGGEADLANDAQMDKMREEIFAYISGDIHEGTNETLLRPMFRDFDAVRAAWEALVEDNRGRTARSRYSRKEDGANGREEVERRTEGEVQQDHAGGAGGNGQSAGEDGGYGDLRSVRGMSQGQRPVHAWAEGGLTVPEPGSVAESEAYIVQDEYNLPVFVVKSDIFNQNHSTAPAFSSRGQVFLREDLPESGRGDIGAHEAGHAMKQLGYQPYLDFIDRAPDFVDQSTREAGVLMEGAAQHLGINLFDMSEQDTVDLFDEINNMVYGAIHAGRTEILELVRPAFYDFDAYSAELTQIHEQFKRERGGTQARESRKGFSVDRELDREIRQIVKEAREGGRSEEAVQADIRDTMDRALTRQKEQQKAIQKAARGRRSARELRERIERHVAKLSKAIRKPTDKKHIPEQLRTTVAAMLDAINLESVYTVDPETGKRRKGGEGDPTKRTEAFWALREQYEAILNRPDDYNYVGVLDPNLMDNLAEVIRMRDTPLFEMSLDQLTTVWQTVKGVEASITSANKLLGESRYAGVAELAYGIRESSRGKRAKNNYGGSGLGRITGFGDQLLNTDMMNSLTFLHLFGDGGDALYHELQAARDQKTRIMQETVRLAKQVVGKTNVDKLQKKIHTFQLEGGELKLSTAQLMSLYELNQRQQAQDHIYKGGIRPGPRASSVSRDKSPGENVAAVLGRMDAPSSVIHVTQADVVSMLSELSEEEIRIADGLQSIMQGYLADVGNRESMKVYGYEKFTEDHYFPISSDPNQVQSKIGDILEDGERRPVSVAEWGSAQGTVLGADNGLLLGDIFDVFAQHAVDMATYASHLGALEDVNRVRNFAFRNAEGHRSGTIKEIIQRVAGKGGNAYLDKLLQDISRGTARGGVAGLSRLTANYKAASVGLNLRVALQQPTSYARALAVMSPKYLADPRVLKPGGWKKALKYAPIAQWKDWGNFEINQGRQFQNILFDTDSPTEKLRNRTMIFASFADSITWGRLWNACELEILDTRPSLQEGSEEFYSAVAQRFTDVVDQTQVVDNVLGRSQFMRSGDNLAKMAASYMGEPTQTYNMLYRAYRDMAQEQDPKKRSQAIKRLGRTAAAVTFSAFMTAVAAALWDGVRDDEDRDEKYWERVLKHIGPNFAQNVNPAGMLPYARDILSIVQGYDVSRMDLEAVTSLASALQNMWKAVNGEGRYTIRGAALNLAAELSRITGLPLATVKRDAQALARFVGVETEDWYFQYQVERALNSVFYSGNRREFYDIAFGALADGDLDVYEQITQDLMSNGVKGSTIESAMRTRLKKTQEEDPSFTMNQAGLDLIGVRPQYREEEQEEKFSADDLSPEARTSYNEQRAEDYREWVDALEENGGFEKLDDEGKDKLLSAADHLASDIALRDHSRGAFTEANMDQWERWATKGAEYGVDPSEALLFKAAYDMAEGEKDEDGDPISGSKKENALELAADLMPWLTDRELEYLMSNYWAPEDRELKEMKEGKFLG